MMSRSRSGCASFAAGVMLVTSCLTAAAQEPLTAQLSGRVVALDAASTPVRRAVVKVSGGGLAQSRSTITDDEGRFVLDRLPAGRFTLTASRPPYVRSAYGANAP